MAAPIKGYEGTVSVSGTVVAWVNTWEINLEVEEQTVGPFINDGGVLYTYTTSKSLAGSLEATVPSGKDPGQTAIIQSALNGNQVAFSLVSAGGYTVTIPSGVTTTFTLGQDASETVTLSAEFRSAGTFTIT